MQRVLGAQKFSLFALIFLGFAATSLVVAQGSALPVQLDRPILAQESRPESSAIVYTQANPIAAPTLASVREAKAPLQAVGYPQAAAARALPLRLAVIDVPAEPLQQRGKAGVEKWGVRQPTFPELDVNRDGVISREEAKQWPTLDKQFDRVDKDGDQKVGRDELLEFETNQLVDSILDFSREE